MIVCDQEQVLAFVSEERIVHLRTILVTTMVAATAAFAQAQNPITADSPYQVRYASNLTIGDSVVNISNTGASMTSVSLGTSTSTTGTICANVYAFAADEQIVSCCSCPVTPNGLVSLSAQRDLIANGLTPGVPTSIVIKLVATAPVGGSCSGAASTVATAALVPGMVAWGTTLHANTSAAAGTYDTTETAFTPASPSAGELGRLATVCGFIQSGQGSGFGICNSCRLGGLGSSSSKL
jgi:hypothetical protein